jgi:YidC/Oxa1 family membrane protein insertase
MFFVFAVNVPLAVIIYWVTTNFWSVGQQYILLRSIPVPAGADAQAAPAGAAALTDNGEGRKGLGPLSMFRGSAQSRAEERSPAGNKNGNNRSAKASDGKAPPKQGGPAAKGAQAKPAQAKPAQGGGGRQGASGRQGTSANRRSSSRSSGKGKSSGPRRGKR